LKFKAGQTIEGGFDLAVEAVFVAIHHFEGAGAVAEALESDGGSGGGLEVGDFSRLLVAFVVEAGTFDVPQTAEAPFGYGQDLDESLLGGVLGLVIVLEIGQDLAEVFEAFRAEDYAAGQHAVADAIFGAAGFALRSDWARRFERVDAIGGDLFVSCHK
jgi:hypothetical protein